MLWASASLQDGGTAQVMASWQVQAHHKGVMITSVDPTAPSSAQVQVGDVLLSFDQVKIANDGMNPTSDWALQKQPALAGQQLTSRNKK